MLKRTDIWMSSFDGAVKKQVAYLKLRMAYDERGRYMRHVRAVGGLP